MREHKREPPSGPSAESPHSAIGAPTQEHHYMPNTSPPRRGIMPPQTSKMAALDQNLATITWQGAQPVGAVGAVGAVGEIPSEIQPTPNPHSRYRHDAPIETHRPDNRPMAQLITGCVLATIGLIAAIFGLKAVTSASETRAEAKLRAEQVADIEQQRSALAEQALAHVFALTEVTDAVTNAIQAGNAYRQAADRQITITNEAVALENEGKHDEATQKMVTDGTAAFADAASAQQRFNEAVARLQELLA